MNCQCLLFRAHTFSSSLSRSLSKSRISVLRISRNYATHRDSLNPSQLSQSLDTKRPPPRPDQTVGPFQLGVSQSPFGTEKVRKWSELSTGGKLKRTTARTTNLAVIIFGAGLSAVLVYCVTSELFSKNSPTVLYNDACERIKASPQVAKYLHGPLAFHTTPPLLERPRHRNHQVSSQIFLDPYGREHMMMNFYVQGREPGSVSNVSDSYLEAATRWVHEKSEHLSEMTSDEMVQWTKDRSWTAWEQFHRAFKYLIGAPVSRNPMPESSSDSFETHKSPEGSAQKWTGLFSSLRRTRSSSVETPLESPGKVYTDGEGHADFIRNSDGNFVCRYILIDIPNSRSRNPVRVFVERAPNVRENEPVLRWNS